MPLLGGCRTPNRQQPSLACKTQQKICNSVTNATFSIFYPIFYSGPTIFSNIFPRVVLLRIGGARHRPQGRRFAEAAAARARRARARVRQEPHGGVERERGGHLRRPRARRVAGAVLEVAELDGATASAVVARGVAHRVVLSSVRDRLYSLLYFTGSVGFLFLLSRRAAPACTGRVVDFESGVLGTQNQSIGLSPPLGVQNRNFELASCKALEPKIGVVVVTPYARTSACVRAVARTISHKSRVRAL